MESNAFRLLLDVRNPEEVASVRYNPNEHSKLYKHIVYIPSNLIKYNVDFLLEYFKSYTTIDIICQSGKRSHKIKDKYFKHHENVHVKSIHFNTLEDAYVIKSQGVHLSMTRKIQIISGSIILILFVLLFFYEKAKYLFLGFGLMMLYVGISGNCFMTPILNKEEI
jgi:rhodanese-related sulfurtransferase